MKEERVLTKQHIFNYEMKYKSRFMSMKNDNDFIITEILLHKPLSLELIDEICVDIQYCMGDDFNKVCEFISDFKDVIDFRCVFSTDYNTFKRVEIEKLTELFSDYFDMEIWDYVSKEISYENIEFLRKFKDKICWCEAPSYIDYDLDVCLEFKDYINFDKLLFMTDEPNDFKEQLSLYMKDHIEEILTYKRKDD